MLRSDALLDGSGAVSSSHRQSGNICLCQAIHSKAFFESSILLDSNFVLSMENFRPATIRLMLIMKISTRYVMSEKNIDDKPLNFAGTIYMR